MTTAAVDTNISTLTPEDQARTGISTVGGVTTVTVTGAPISGLIVETNTLAPSLRLAGKFTKCSFVGGARIPERFTATEGSVIKKSLYDFGNDSFKDVAEFQGDAVAKKVKMANFKKGDKLKYKGDTYKYSDIDGNTFAGLSTKEIKLV